MDTLDLATLILAAVAFVASHLGISSTALRPWLVGRLGRPRYLALYSIVSLACLAWLIWAYGNAPFLPLWPESEATRWLAVAVMPVALIFVAGALRRDNPTLMTARPGSLVLDRGGIFAITRHPLMWGIGLTAIIHILATGDLSSLILFGAVGGLALVGTVLQDARKRREDPALWSDLAAGTSNLPFSAILAGRAKLQPKRLAGAVVAGLAIYALLLASHEFLFGLSPLP
jgi:uncharacterized membrane protein